MDWLSPHVALELENLAQGQLLAHVRESIVKAQQDVVAFLRKHGDASKGAKATVTLKLTFKIDNPAEAHVKIQHSLSATPPTLPAGETSGYVENDGKGSKIMVVRGANGPLDTRNQLSLFAGTVKFDPATGEIVPDPALAKGPSLAEPLPYDPSDTQGDFEGLRSPAQPPAPGIDLAKLGESVPFGYDPEGA